MSYQGFFRPENISKYEGDHNKIVYRSSWEHFAFQWCDKNRDVVKWASEEFFIPYQCKTDGKPHRYFPDIKITYASGKTVLIEIKPHCQVLKPKLTKGKKTSTILNEAFTYAKNCSKWEAAKEYCRHKGWTFQIWDENVLNALGMPLVNRSNLKK